MSVVPDRLVRWLVAAGSAAIGLLLAAEALLFLLHGRGSFARFGFPDFPRVLLAGAEIASGVLFAVPRPEVRRAGGTMLAAVLAWAAGFHFALRQSAAALYVFAAAVLVLIAIPVRARP